MHLAAKGGKRVREGVVHMAAYGVTIETVAMRCDKVPDWYKEEIDEQGRLPAFKRGRTVWVGAEYVMVTLEALLPQPRMVIENGINRPAVCDRFMDAVRGPPTALAVLLPDA
jgi:hypothetical protein